MRFLPALVILGVLGVVLPAVADEPITPKLDSPYQGCLVVRVSPSTADQLARVEALAVSTLSERVGLGPIEVIVHRDNLNALRDLGLEPQTLVEDLQSGVDAQRADIDHERAARAARILNPLLARAAGSPHDIRFWDNYRDRGEIEAYLFALAAAYPDLATMQQIGTSVEGHAMWAILISSPDSPENPRDRRAAVVWNAAQHAREWITPTTALYFADQLLQRSSSDPRVTGLLDTIEFAIVPITNPDGYEYTWTTERFWRKNRRDNGNGSHGIDLNRNWSYEWGGTGSSGSSSSDIYRGPNPFSEPESTALSNLALSFGDRFSGGIDYHSSGQLLLWPWSYAYWAVLPEPERTIISDLSIDMAGAILESGGLPYHPQKSTDLYAAAGNTLDWYQGATPGYGLSLELRTNVFDPPREHVMACAIENFPSALLFAEGVTQAVRIRPTAPIPPFAEAGTSLTIEARILNALGTLDPASPMLHVRSPGSAEEISIPMVSTGTATYAAEILPHGTQGRTSVRITAASTFGEVVSFPVTGSVEITTLTENTQTLFADDFETDLGWDVGSPDDDATSGLWERGDPGLDVRHPQTDTTPDGTDCYVTGLSANNDVDHGYTRLVSPSIAIPHGAGDILLSVDLWRNVSTTDPSLVELAPDNSEDWSTAYIFWPTTAGWHRHSLRVNDFILPQGSFRVRFTAMDIPTGRTVEMAVDGVEILYAPTPSLADLNDDGYLDHGDIRIFVTLYLDRDLAVDFNTNGLLDSGDITAFISAFLLGRPIH